MTSGVERVRAVLDQHGWGERIRILEESTHTAQQAADALGVSVAQIAKSIVFRASNTDRAIVVITRGDRRVDEKRLRQWLGEPVERAHPDWVRDQTGYPIGGVSPLGHGPEAVVVVDADLEQFPLVFAAAGHPQTIFAATPEELQHLSHGQVVGGISR